MTDDIRRMHEKVEKLITEFKEEKWELPKVEVYYMWEHVETLRAQADKLLAEVIGQVDAIGSTERD